MTLETAANQLEREHAPDQARWWKHYTLAREREGDAERAHAGRRAWVKWARLALEDAREMHGGFINPCSRRIVAGAEADLRDAEGGAHA